MPTTMPPLLFFFLLLLLTTTARAAVSPAASPRATPSSTSTLDPKQLRALQSLNIPTAKDPCTSFTCDSAAPFRHLTSLTLANCSSSLSLSPSALSSLSTLSSLSLLSCPVPTVRLPPSLAANLRRFSAVSSLKKLTGVWLSRLDNLTALTVSKTPVTASGPSVIITNMRFLRSLTLSETNLSGFLPRHWHCPNLTYVDLSGNHLKGKIPESLTLLENLEHLNLSSNSLNDTIPATIGDLGSLQNLSLASNLLSGSIPESLAALPGLMHLDLGFNQLNGTVPSFIRDMRELKYLNLESNNFRGVLPFNASFIKGLEVFRVGENSNLCYNRSVLGSKVRLGIAACDKHGKPIPPPAAKDSSSSSDDDSSDDDDYSDNVEQKKHHSGPSKVVLGVAIGLSSIVFLIVFLVLLSKCCK